MDSLWIPRPSLGDVCVGKSCRPRRPTERRASAWPTCRVTVQARMVRWWLSSWLRERRERGRPGNSTRLGRDGSATRSHKHLGLVFWRYPFSEVALARPSISRSPEPTRHCVPYAVCRLPGRAPVPSPASLIRARTFVVCGVHYVVLLWNRRNVTLLGT